MPTENVNVDEQIAQIEAQLIRLQGALDVWRALRQAGARVEVEPEKKPDTADGKNPG